MHTLHRRTVSLREAASSVSAGFKRGTSSFSVVCHHLSQSRKTPTWGSHTLHTTCPPPSRTYPNYPPLTDAYSPHSCPLSFSPASPWTPTTSEGFYLRGLSWHRHTLCFPLILCVCQNWLSHLPVLSLKATARTEIKNQWLLINWIFVQRPQDHLIAPLHTFVRLCPFLTRYWLKLLA